MLKLVLLAAVLKVKLEFFLKVLATHLQVKFFIIAFLGLLLNAAKFWIDLKKGHSPQKVSNIKYKMEKTVLNICIYFRSSTTSMHSISITMTITVTMAGVPAAATGSDLSTQKMRWTLLMTMPAHSRSVQRCRRTDNRVTCPLARPPRVHKKLRTVGRNRHLCSDAPRDYVDYCSQDNVPVRIK